ncbi:MAG TPA: cupin domain-containing protein [Gammaproteobacteria bacterium]|nr:cupin domain-containing protein [Gammaproteobacteria bacterium]
MKQQTLIGLAVTVALATFVAALAPSSDAQVGVERRILLQQDLPIPGYEILLAEVTLGVGGREGKHWHSGTLVGQIIEGDLTLELEGQPTRVVRAGESVIIEPRQVHEGINKGTVTIKALVTFVVEKGKPLSTSAP